MNDRRYSLSEIDQMRKSCRIICRGDKEYAENQLRTYMMNGTGPEELAEFSHQEFIRMKERVKATNPEPPLRDSDGTSPHKPLSASLKERLLNLAAAHGWNSK